MSTTTPQGHSAQHPLHEYRCYSFKELAGIYYPHISPRQASRGLRQLIHRDPLLLAEIEQKGYRCRLRTLSPAIVACIVHHLGSPSEFFTAQ